MTRHDQQPLPPPQGKPALRTTPRNTITSLGRTMENLHNRLALTRAMLMTVNTHIGGALRVSV